MQEPHRKGVAIHPDPESCASGHKARARSVDRGREGRVLSREIYNRRASGGLLGVAALDGGARPHLARRYRESCWNQARSETSSTHANTPHGSREVPRPPDVETSGRYGQVQGQGR